ncbi:MAG: M48 family metalloprotease [Desulfobacterales bacterium]|nr:M48 family metalloprotease [Desulfobacterales bacterium]
MKSRFSCWFRIVSIIILCCFSGSLGVMSGPGIAAAAFSVGEEREVGERLLSIVRKEFTLLDDPDISQYVSGLGRELLAPLGPQFFNYHFFVISNRELNAFAAPSGLIFIHSGLIEAISRENELVSVLAHEVAHAASRHIAGQIDKAEKMTAGSVALMIAGIAMGAGPLGEALITGSMAANAAMGLKFSRRDEEEADRLAFKWMQEEGRDPQAMVDMLREMRRISRFRSANLPPYLLSHPEPGKRIGYVQDMILFGPKKKYRTVDEFAFQRIKARVLSLTMGPEALLPRYSRMVADASASEAEKGMARYGLALVYQQQARYDRAEAELKAVQVRFPDKAMLKTDLGVLYFDSGRFQEARGLFEETLAAEPDNGYAAYYLARTLQQTGHRLQALRMYEDLLAALPDYTKLYFELGKLETKVGEPGAGAYYLGMYHWYSGQAEQAKTQLKRAIKELPANNGLRAKAEAWLVKIKKLEKE